MAREAIIVEVTAKTMSDQPRRINVAVVGNSNSVAVTSYAQILAMIPELNVTNHSLGGVPNIALLAFLTNESVKFANLDVIIVDVAVIESQLLYPGSPYSRERSERFIDVFASEVRSRSKAKLLFLILPTLSAMLYPNKTYAENHYLECARICGASVLNAYALIRRFGGLDAEGAPRRMVALVEKFLKRFELPDTLRDPYVWRLWLRQHPATMQKPDIGTAAFAESCFEDALHVSRAMHDVIATIIRAWIGSLATERHANDDEVQSLRVARALPEVSVGAAEFVKRESKLISRHLVTIRTGGVVRYRCPPDFVPVGIMVNESGTSGYLNLRSTRGAVSLDARFLPFPMPWKALVILILEDIGDGDISVSISDRPEAPLSELKPYYSVAKMAPGPQNSAELGELLLVHRTVLDGARASVEITTLPELERLEDAPSVQDTLEQHSAFGAKAVDGVRRSNAVINRSAFNAAIDRFQPEAAGARLIEDKARLLALAGQFSAALAALADGRRLYPDDHQLVDMENVIKPLLP